MNALKFVSLAMLVAGSRGALGPLSRGDVEVAFDKLSESLLGLGSKDAHKNNLPFSDLKKLNELHLLSLEARQCVGESLKFWNEENRIGRASTGDLKKECERLITLIKCLEELKAFLVEKEGATEKDEEKIEQALCNAERCRHRLQLTRMCIRIGDRGKYLQEESLSYSKLRKAIECVDSAIFRIYDDDLPAKASGRYTDEKTSRLSKKHSSFVPQAKEAPRMSSRSSPRMYGSYFSNSSSEWDSDPDYGHSSAYRLSTKSKRPSAY